MDSSIYKIGDTVRKSWKASEVGKIEDVVIVHNVDGGEHFAYVVKFRNCEGWFLEGDLAPVKET